MSKRARRQFSPDEKLKIIADADAASHSVAPRAFEGALSIVDAARDALQDKPSRAPIVDGILEAERRAVCEYALSHPKDEYRRLAWQMIDEDVAYVRPSTVYRVLASAQLLSRWK